ncbi:MAG: VWA domain-containing protein [Acidobacteria bacterium]|nr:VWA domain-containing protein [Acidobacteriota bacterium]MCA1649814.1 VWA domain-containing protein [Acidobacteriota bacterium]
MKASRAFLVGLAVVFCAAGVRTYPRAAQSTQQPAPSPPSPQQPPPPQPFRTGTNLVRVDATVIDRHGEPVTSLTADDFEIDEDGVRQVIQSFKLVRASGHPAPDDDISLTIRSPAHAAAEAARDDVRVFLVFWDEYHIEPFIAATRARNALTKFMRTAFGPQDLVALMDPLLPVDAIRFSRDRTALADAVHRLQGRLGVFVPVRSAIEEAQLQQRDVRRIRAQVTASALKSAAAYLGTLREGRKTILFISQGLGALGRDAAIELQDVVRAANESNTAIYTLDPRGLMMRRPSDTLHQLADNTGGQALLNTNSFDSVLGQVVREASAFYLLGYVSPNTAVDGRFHKIRVRLRRDGLEVRARKGYWAPSLAEMTRSREAAARAESPPDIAIALGALPLANARTNVEVWTGSRRRPDGATDVTIAWMPRPITGPAASLSVIAQSGGARAFDGVVETSGVSFQAPPGPLRLQIGVRDGRGEIIERITRDVTVPDLSGAPLAMSSPILLRAANALQLRTLLAGPAPAPFPGREFTHTDRVLIRFELYGTAAREARVSARLRSRTGTTLVTMPVTALDAAGGLYQIDVPLSSTARGEFVIAIEASNGTQRATAQLGIRVGS